MNAETLAIAKREAKRFLAALEKVAREESSFYVGTRATGELRRASMDLTRALADLRRPS